MKSILVALDGSHESMAALNESVEWASRLNAELRGIFVEDDQRFLIFTPEVTYEGGLPHPIPLPKEELEKVEAQVKEEGAAIRKAFDQATKGKVRRSSLTIVRGDVNHLLTKNSRSCELVVMGKRGKNDPPDSRKPGPTTETIIHQALRPVLVVPDEPRSDGPVLFAYDGSIGVQRVMVPGIELAGVKGSGVTVLTVNKNEEQARKLQEMLQHMFRPYGIEAGFRIAKGKADKIIVEVAEMEQAGMIVMGAFGQGPFKELLFGSTTLKVLENSACPVLLMA